MYVYRHIAITFDGWISCANENYLTITAHFILNSALQCATLAVNPIPAQSTALNLKQLMEGVFQNFPGLSIVGAVTDNASNMIAKCRELQVSTEKNDEFATEKCENLHRKKRHG